MSQKDDENEVGSSQNTKNKHIIRSSITYVKQIPNFIQKLMKKDEITIETKVFSKLNKH